MAVGDALVTGAESHPGPRSERPAATIDELHAAVDGWRAMAGIARLRLATPQIRTGVESPWETVTRLVIVDGGLPEPEVDGDVVHDGSFVARPDLMHRDERVAIQYDGDGHRTDRSQWQADIARDERLRAAGWRVIHVTHETLRTPWVLHDTIRTALDRWSRGSRPVVRSRRAENLDSSACGHGSTPASRDAGVEP